MTWDDFLRDNEERLSIIKDKLNKEKERAITIYPQANNTMRAFRETPLEQTKVVILGQDPYINANQAMGLSFSVPSGEKIPPSLRNIFKEIESDLGIKCNSTDGDLTRWAHQGVFLLNSALTVRAGDSNSHQYYWAAFTDLAIAELNKDDSPKVFLFWGNFAKQKSRFITNPRHLVLMAAHPSPLSATKGFFGCKHFSRTNEFLREHGLEEIQWQ